MQFRKIAAIAGSAIMAGLSIATPALATSVTQLNKFSDVVSVSGTTVNYPLFVYGANAKTSDVQGATNLALTMAGFAITTEEIATTGAAEAVTGGLKFEQPGNALVFKENIRNIYTGIGGSDIPELLKSGTFVTEMTGTSYSYNQYIDFGPNLYTTFDREDDISTTPQPYFVGQDGQEIYTYKLEFPQAVEFDDTKADDVLEGTSINMLGLDYTILSVTENVANQVEAMEMIAGKAVKIVVLNTPEAFSVDGASYNIELIAVNVAESKATLNIDGVTYVIKSGVTKQLPDGTSVTITDIFASSKESTPDSVKVFVGAKKLTLKDGDALQVDEVDVDGTLVDLNPTANQVSGWEITVNLEDDLFLQKGDKFEDVISSTFSFMYNGGTPEIGSTDRSTMKFETDGTSRVKFTYTNKDGESVKVPAFYNDGGIALGYSAAKPLIVDEAAAGAENIFEDAYFIVSSLNSQTSHILQLTKVDAGNKQITLKNLGTGSTWKVSYTGTTGVIRLNNQEYAFSVDESVGAEAIAVDMNGDGDFTDLNVPLYTEYGTTAATINFYTADIPGTTPVEADGGILITEADDENDYPSFLGLAVGIDLDGDIVPLAPVVDPLNDLRFTEGVGLQSIGDSDRSSGMTAYGTYVEYDSQTNKVNVQYPKYQMIQNLYIGAGDMKVTTSGGAGTVTITKVVEIPASIERAKLDSEITASDKSSRDLILVGGPCINTLVSELATSGKFQYNCDTWPGENFGWIQAISGAFAEGKTAMIVAGTRAEDTNMAIKAIEGGKLASVTASSAKIVDGNVVA